MKKQLLFSIFTFFSACAMAQSTTVVGLRGGISNNTIHGDAMTNLNSLLDVTDGMITMRNRTGFFAGPYVSIPLSEKISVEPALYYTQKGASITGNLDIKSVNFLAVQAGTKLNAHYIDLPVLLKANFNGFQVFAGPQVSYLAKANLKTTAGLLGINLLHNNSNLTDQFNRWDAGVTGGVGYQFANGINLTASYDYGLSRLDANKMVNAYNRSFKVGLGFHF